MSQGYRDSIFNPPEGVGLFSRIVYPIVYRYIRWILGNGERQLHRAFLFSGGLLVLMAALIAFTPADPLLVWLEDGYEEPTIVYGVDDKGAPVPFAEFYNFNRRIIHLSESDLKEMKVAAAFMASEDTRFTSHFGLDIPGILRAVFVNLAAGRIKEGASTITQQAARLRFLDRGRTFARKAREASLALLMEMRYPKHKILEIYFNEVPLGHGTLGIEAAAQFFFNKSARDLSWGEATVLSSLTTRPRDYSPLKYPRNSMAKIRVTFRRLVERGVLSKDEAEKEYRNIIDNYFLTLNRYPEESSFSRRQNDFPYATEYLRTIALPRQFRPNLNQAGYRIYTTLNVHKQQVAERVMTDWLKQLNRTRVSPRSPFMRFEVFDEEFGESYPMLSRLFGIAPFKIKMTRQQRDLRMKYLKEMNQDLILLALLGGESNVAGAFEHDLTRQTENPEQKIDYIEGSLISLHPATGAIEALVGGSGFTPGNQLLRFMAKRQPGSAFKPVLYSAGLQYTQDHPDAKNTLTAATVLEDAPVQFLTEDLSEYEPENYGSGYLGPIRMRKALTLSRNIWAVNAYVHVGPTNINPYMERIIGTAPGSLPRDASLALGSHEMSPLEMASIYTMFPTGGYRAEPYFIDRIESKAGRVLYQHEGPKRDRRISEQVAYIMTSLMQDVVREGTGTGARIPGLPVAGKTGTTNRFTGAWFAGFIPDNVTVVQFAYDFNKSMGSGASGGSLSAPPWRQFMERTYNRHAPREYTMPQGITTASVCEGSGQRPSSSCRETLDEIFVSGTEPREICNLHSGGSPGPGRPRGRTSTSPDQPSLDDSGF